MLFRFDSVGKEFGGDWLFRRITAQCNPGDHIGLIGRNGSGKTTLFDLIQGRSVPEEGQVIRASNLTISRVEQIPRFEAEGTVLQEALAVFDYLKAMEARMHAIEHEIAEIEGSVPENLAAEYEHLRHRFRHQGGYDYHARTEAVLHGLGFSQDSFEFPCDQLSGGQQSRLLLGKALLRESDLLLLDEPTNHLDIQAILWLTDFLKEQKKPFVVVSHDRQFLDRVSSRTWEIEGGTLYDYPGAFSRARELRVERIELETREYERQQEWRERTEDYVRRNIAGQKTKQAQSRRKRLKRTDWLERPVVDESNLKLRIEEGVRGGATSIRIHHGKIGYDTDKPTLEKVNLLLRRGERLGIVGGNGTGKTTLLRTIMYQIPILDGTIEWGINTSPAYFSQTQDQMDGNRTVYDNLRDLDSMCTDLELRNLAARFLFKEDDIFKTVGQLSGGERSRLALARLFYHPANVLLMDEPTNHLDIPSREALEEALGDFGGTLVVVSHDLYFLQNVVDQFYYIRDRELIPAYDIAHLERIIQGRDLAPVQKDQAEQPPAEAPSVAPAVEKTTAGLSKNERQRRERRVIELEARIEALEARQQQIVESLQNQYDDFARLHDLSEQHQRNDEELTRLYHEWEDVMHELSEA